MGEWGEGRVARSHPRLPKPRAPSLPPPRAEKDKDIARDMARFAFCKQDASLEEACKRLLALRPLARDAGALPAL